MVNEEMLKPEETIESLENERKAMDEARIKKVDAGATSFIEQITVASEKYLTINGYLQARDTLKMMKWKDKAETAIHDDALALAEDMSKLIDGIRNKFVQGYGEDKEGFVKRLNTFLTEGNWHDAKFVKNHIDDDYYEYAREFLVCQALSNMAGLLDDIYCFNEHAIEEMEKIDEKIAELKSEKSKESAE